MFKKLLKHDFISVSKILFPILISVIIISILGVLDIFFMKEIFTKDGNTISVLLNIISVIAFVFIIFALIIATAGTQVVIYYNFYKTLLTDEGYLTFTLPVKPQSIILSKLLNATIWTIITSLVIILCIIFMLITAFYSDMKEIWEDFTLLTQIFSEFEMPLDGFAIIILYIILSIALFAFTQLLYFVAMFIGANGSKKNKGLSAIVCIFIANFILSTGSSIIMSIIAIFSSAISTFFSNPLATLYIMLSIMIFFLAVATVGLFFFLKHSMEKNLNLP